MNGNLCSQASLQLATRSNMENFQLYQKRWAILALFSLISMTNEVIWISLSSVTSIVEQYYRVDSIAINWLSLIYMVLYVFVVLSSYILDKYGLKFTIIIGALLNAIGSCLRAIGANRDGFVLALLGNTSAAMAQCFILFVPPRLAAVWFGDCERATASSIGVLMNMFGVAIGFLMGGTMIPSSTDFDCKVRNGMYRMLISQAVFCTFLALLSLVVIQDSPPTPPSRSQELVLKSKRRDFVNEISFNGSERTSLQSTITADPAEMPTNKATKTLDSEPQTVPHFAASLVLLAKDKSFHLVCQAYGLYFGLFAAYNTILNQMVVTKYSGKEKEIGYMGFAAVNCGLFAIFFSGIWLDKTRRYKALSTSIFMAASMTMLLFTLLLEYDDNFMLLFPSFCVFGFFSYPYMSAGLEHVAEITYPIPEGTTSGILLLVGNIYGVILSYIVGAAIEQGGRDIGGYLMTGCYFIGFILVSLNSAPLKRSEADLKCGYFHN